ncbi:DUF4190 domain-containing protein [Georgenia sp. EYE_87]|uniref:DUF4190 domain-containing protein n=1 Tax=Georgenia sp. EYE_87 TaxID=2853448 RepID=UPI002003888D|nr:DUF4190 domain-containing protein [Georgenia sp. EYE_87]MCK6212748.1 DUF4190 domain-containing protein [Georgenia sp. EYE_87]
MGEDDGRPGQPGAARPENPFAPPSVRPAPAPRAYPSDYATAPAPGTGPSPYAPPPSATPAAGPPPPHRPADDGAALAFPGSDDVDHRVVLAGPGYTSAVVRNDPLAVAALVLGVLAVVPGVGLAAVVCGHLALRRQDGYGGGRGLAVAGLALGYALTALWALLLLAIWGLRTS